MNRSIPPEPPELTEALEPLSEEVREALRVQWRSITPYAIENAHRLDQITNVMKRILRRVNVALPLFAVFLLGVGILSLKLLSDQGDTLKKVDQGRHVSLGVTCATLSAVAQAGRVVIVGATKAPPPMQEQALEQLGFPPFKVRHAQAEVEARQYVSSISKAVDRQIGRKGDGLVLKDGTINCAKLADLAQLDGHGNLSTGQRSPPKK